MTFWLFWVLTRLQRLLFALVWRLFLLLYLAIGLGALAVMFLIEAQFFLSITGHPLLGYGIAAIFEVAKIGTSMVKQAIIIANRVTRVKVSPLIQGVTVMFQVAVIVVSIICSVVVVTAYLEGRSLDAELKGGKTSSRTGQQPVVASTLAILENGLHVTLHPDTFISVLAITLSVLFQAVSYIVFGHLIAMQAREIEHLFEVKTSRAEAKKNFGLTT